MISVMHIHLYVCVCVCYMYVCVPFLKQEIKTSFKKKLTFTEISTVLSCILQTMLILKAKTSKIHYKGSLNHMATSLHA